LLRLLRLRRRLRRRWLLLLLLAVRGRFLRRAEREPGHLDRGQHDRAYELDLLRQLKLANQLTEKEHGPRPLYQPPPPPKRKPSLPSPELPPQYQIQPQE
jgi:hypothetical protein